MIKRAVAVLIVVVVAFAAAGCGGTEDAKKFLSQVSIEDRFPEVPEKSFATMAEARYAVYEQEIGACRMYYDAYSACDYSQYAETFGQSERIQALFSEKRMSLFSSIDEKLRSNLGEILSDVTDCANKENYIGSVSDDCIEFFDELKLIENESDDSSAFCSVLKNHAESDNIVAKDMILYSKDSIIDAVVERTRQNIACDDSDVKIYISENNQIIEAMNECYGAVDSERALTISENNHALYERLAESAGELTVKEREELLSGITEPLGI